MSTQKPRFYNREGEPIDLTEWALKSAGNHYPRVAFAAGTGWQLSTKWLGVDLRLKPDDSSPPLIYRTAVGVAQGVLPEVQDRIAAAVPDDYEIGLWATAQEAEAGHTELLKVVLAAVADVDAPPTLTSPAILPQRRPDPHRLTQSHRNPVDPDPSTVPSLRPLRALTGEGMWRS